MPAPLIQWPRTALLPAANLSLIPLIDGRTSVDATASWSPVIYSQRCTKTTTLPPKLWIARSRMRSHCTLLSRGLLRVLVKNLNRSTYKHVIKCKSRDSINEREWTVAHRVNDSGAVQVCSAYAEWQTLKLRTLSHITNHVKALEWNGFWVTQWRRNSQQPPRRRWLTPLGLPGSSCLFRCLELQIGFLLAHVWGP